MSVQAITMSEFVKEFKEAKTEDERAVAILDFVKQSQVQAKEETLKEIFSQDLATKKDLLETKTSLIWAMIGICGVWVPAIIGIITAVILKHA